VRGADRGGCAPGPYFAACEKVLTEAGLKIQLHPNGTAIEGEWQPVFAAIEACHQAVHAMGSPRIYTQVKVRTHTADFARRHRDVIARFGRFPHRDAVLGRVLRAEELAFLQTPGSRF